eukprot:1884378-Amphidinium_carterae.1
MSGTFQAMNSLSALPDLVKSMSKGTKAIADRSRPSLIDHKGLGRPTTFDSRKEDEYSRWSRKLESFVEAVFPNATKYLTWCADQDGPVDMRAARDLFADADLNPGDCVLDFDQADAQIFAALLQLTEGEAYDIVANSDRCAGEAA